MYQRYLFGLAFVTDISDRGDGDHIEETVTFTYGATQMTNIKQTTSGTTTPVSAAWNVTTNTNALQIAGLPAVSPIF